MRLDYQSPESLAPVIEALLFASDEPLSAQTLRAVILGEESPRTDISLEQTPEEEKAQAQLKADNVTRAQEVTNQAAVRAEVVAEALVAEEAPDEEDQAAMEERLAREAEFGQIVAPEESATLEESLEVEFAEAPSGVAAVTEKKQRKKKQLIELVTIHVAVQHLNSIYDETDRAFRIVEIAGGYQFATRAEHSDYVARLFKEKSRRRLSGAALESLAIIAYKQPVSKMDVENIRGVNCDEVLKSLMEKNLITITGRSEAVGRPLLYGTTVDFLRHFGLHTLSDLPRPREIEELMKEEAVRATTLEEAASEFVSPAPEDGSNITVDEAIVVARELAQMESAVLEAENQGGIELDVEAMESMNPGHPDPESAGLLESGTFEEDLEDENDEFDAEE